MHEAFDPHRMRRIGVESLPFIIVSIRYRMFRPSSVTPVI